MSKILIIIPARLKSTRLPNKLLKKVVYNKTVLSRCVEQTLQASKTAFSGTARVVVAVDELSDFKPSLKEFEGQIDLVQTQHNHLNGTSRAAEVVKRPEYSQYQFVLIVQGDELFVYADDLINLYLMLIEKEISTIVRAEFDLDKSESQDTVKVTYNMFSKEIISMSRKTLEEKDKGFWEHVGVYGHLGSGLRQLAKEQDTQLMLERNIELMKAIEYGFNVGAFVSNNFYLNVNTQEDLDRAIKLLNKSKEFAA
jgi:3-deoxy-manno-octulosonate cytidylyltransferase (CMP-KDO synthetase)